MSDIATTGALTAAGLEQVIIGGDLGKLSPADRLRYYENVCRSLGLNPLTKPFEYITLNGKLTLYARRDCTDQLRNIHKVNIVSLFRERLDDVYVVTASAETASGRRDESIGAVSIAGLKGEALANAFMKAETKAKRRVTLSIVGLGFLDETEVETIPSAQATTVDTATGEIHESSQIAPPSRPMTPRTRAALEARYHELCDKADVVGVPAGMFQPSWSDEEITTRGRALLKLIAAKEQTESDKAQ